MNALLFLLLVGCRFCCCCRCSPPLLDPPNIDGALLIPGSFLLLHSHRLPSSSSIINPYASLRWLPSSTISHFRPAPTTIYYRPRPLARSSSPFSRRAHPPSSPSIHLPWACAMAGPSPPRVTGAAAAAVSSPTFDDCYDIEDALADRNSELVQILSTAEAKPLIIGETGSADNEKKTAAKKTNQELTYNKEALPKVGCCIFFCSLQRNRPLSAHQPPFFPAIPS